MFFSETIDWFFYKKYYHYATLKLFYKLWPGFPNLVSKLTIGLLNHEIMIISYNISYNAEIYESVKWILKIICVVHWRLNGLHFFLTKKLALMDWTLTVSWEKYWKKTNIFVVNKFSLLFLSLAYASNIIIYLPRFQINLKLRENHCVSFFNRVNYQ